MKSLNQCSFCPKNRSLGIYELDTGFACEQHKPTISGIVCNKINCLKTKKYVLVW